MIKSKTLSANDLAVAKEFVERLAAEIDPQLFDVRLFGSRAHGKGDAESDLDIFVALNQDDPAGKVKSVALQIACDMTIKNGILVSVFVADRKFQKDHEGFSFLESVESEGVLL